MHISVSPGGSITTDPSFKIVTFTHQAHRRMMRWLMTKQAARLDAANIVRDIIVVPDDVIPNENLL